MTDDRSPNDRLTAIESLLMHLQYDLEEIRDALSVHRDDLDGLRRDLDQIRGQVERIDLGPDNRDPKAEKPPHY